MNFRPARHAPVRRTASAPSCRRPALLIGAALGLAVLAGCESPPVVPPSPASTVAAPPQAATAPTPSGTKAPAARAKGKAAPSEVRTRNAMFKLATFEELPGWDKDDLRAGWGAFRYSCGPLQKRTEWRELCNNSRTVAPTEKAMRAFFETNFTVLRILNTDATREGDVTGYFEPLLEGQATRSAEFDTPVLGVPRDLYTLDWGRVPAAQRRGTLRVKPVGDKLVIAAASDTRTYAMDMTRFTLDDRDRKLRLRLVDTPVPKVEPYFTRAEMEARGLPGGIDAPVLAWVNDPVALYAMQVQGSGRILLPDTSVMRVQYAEQNGQPFRPLRVVPRPKVVTRGAASNGPDEFVIEGDEAQADDEPVVTRGGKASPAPSPATPPPGDPLVEELLKGARKPTSAPKPAPAAAAPVATPAPRKSVAPAAGQLEARPPGRTTRLNSDPSYVFFKLASARPAAEGPHGALGVPLTAGRSVAVDPRVTPLGYPMYLSAPAPSGSRVQVQRLVFAQDTGGAIRGALRADYFWGFGAEAGQMARSTRHRGQMWVLLPNAEAARLASSQLVTRGAGTEQAIVDSDGQCLVDDGEFCSEPAD